VIDYLIQTGYPFELAGFVYFLFYLAMSRKGAGERFSQRSKIFTLIASIVLVGSVPLHYGAQPLAIALMLAIVAISIWSTWSDRRPPPAR
jgi:uncharacterized membrane protein